jgi:uncharacterized membrane-anchored protein
MSWTTATHITVQSSAAAAFAGGTCMMTYLDYANALGWPSGNYYASGKMASFGMGACILALVAGTTSSWWALLTVPVLGFILAYMLTRTLGPLVQIVAPLLFIGAISGGLICSHLVR